MIQITWKDPESLDWADFIPESVLDDPTFDGPILHDVRDPNGNWHTAACTVVRHAGGIDLTYQVDGPNVAWGCYPGTTRIIGVEDRLAVEWREPDETGFSPVAATIERVSNRSPAIGQRTPASSLEDLIEAGDLGAVAAERLTQALVRIGQGKFRRGLEKRWGGCALTGLTTPALLRASHIHPWSASDNNEKVDVENGLLLAAHVDALFDQHLVTFNNDGTVRWSNRMSQSESDALGLSKLAIRGLSDGNKHYLERHRKVMDLLDRAARLQS